MVSTTLSYEPQNASSASAGVSFSFAGGLIAPRPEASQARAASVSVRAGRLVVVLVDGREIRVPLTRFPRLVTASVRQRRRWDLIGDGVLIHWPDVDEDIDVPNLLRA